MAEYENKRDLVACMVQGSMTTEERTILEELQQAALQGESAPVISLSKKRQKASHNFLRGEKILTETLNKDNPN